MDINQDRLWNRIHSLGKIGVDKTGAITRWPFTKEDMQAKEWLKNEMIDVGLDVYEDHVGNVIGIYNPTNSTESPVISGSHYDTVINGGMFDGTLGLLSSLEVAQTLKENNIMLKRPFYVIGYKDEEGNRFGGGMIGSKVISGKVTDDDFLLKDANGLSLFEVIKNVGYHPERYKESKINPIYASLELHIEQGKVLEDNDCSVGIVEGIPYIRMYKIKIKGVSAHAGATPMNYRTDPVIAMCNWINEITHIVKNKPYTVATVGKINTFPGSSNVICDHVSLTLDIRSMENNMIDECLLEMKKYEKALEKTGISITYELCQNIEGVKCEDRLKNMMESVMGNRHLSFTRLISGAGHDSQNFKNVCPIAMIFVKSKDGHSHRKEEYSSKEDCKNGANVLLDMVLKLCNE